MNKNVFLWGLYDFANTPLTVAMGGLFLAQWVVLDNHLPDIWYGGVFTAATVVILITSPFWGALSDSMNKRMPLLKWTTLAFIILGLLTSFVIVSPIARMIRVYLVLALFFFLQYVYQISLIFYNLLMESISTPNTRGTISGIGQLFGELGWLLSPLFLLPFSAGMIVLAGEPGRGQVFLPATILMAILGIPMLVWFKEHKPKTKGASPNFSLVLKSTFTGLKRLVKENKNVAIFLFSFMFISDALLTASLYFAIYMDQVFQATDFQKYLALALMEIVNIISCYIVGRLSDKKGIKKLYVIACIDLAIIFAVAPFVSSLSTFYIVSCIIGFGFGAFYTTSRALLFKIAPTKKIGEYFGIFSTFQKFASIIGPLTWGGITLLLINYGVFKYKVAIFSISILVLIGLILATKVKEKRTTAARLGS